MTNVVQLLKLLKSDEQQSVLAYIHHRDRKLKLGSYLLKYHAISTLCKVPWPSIIIGESTHKKPCYDPRPALDSLDQSHSRLCFNVSHQAGLVAIAASLSIEVGVDIVCVSERNELAKAQAVGFDSWVDVYSDVFSPADMAAMKEPIVDRSQITTSDSLTLSEGLESLSVVGHNNSPETGLRDAGRKRGHSSSALVAQVRRFYVFWALKEAYVKMTGEALLAPWLKDMHFGDVWSPKVRSGVTWPAGSSETVVLPDVQRVTTGVSGTRAERDAWAGDALATGFLHEESQVDEKMELWGEEVFGVKVFLKGLEKPKVKSSIVCYGDAHIVATCFELHDDTKPGGLKPWKTMSLYEILSSTLA
ncbi:MAG: hypothetical protein M1814_000002 [Vezdaea aestivalis]|nr:MAG: hypothetical protein M1814_000002 [Vezdaea aestivalis]